MARFRTYLPWNPPQNPFGVGNLTCHDPSGVAITTPQNPFEVGPSPHNPFEVGNDLSPHNPFEVGNDLSLEENSSQAALTNASALQIKRPLPFEFASVSGGEAVGYAFQRQQKFASASGFFGESALSCEGAPSVTQRTPSVSVLGKTGPDPEIKPQLVGASTGRCLWHYSKRGVAGQYIFSNTLSRGRFT